MRCGGAGGGGCTQLGPSLAINPGRAAVGERRLRAGQGRPEGGHGPVLPRGICPGAECGGAGRGELRAHRRWRGDACRRQHNLALPAVPCLSPACPLPVPCLCPTCALPVPANPFLGSPSPAVPPAPPRRSRGAAGDWGQERAAPPNTAQPTQAAAEPTPPSQRARCYRGQESRAGDSRAYPGKICSGSCWKNPSRGGGPQGPEGLSSPLLTSPTKSSALALPSPAAPTSPGARAPRWGWHDLDALAPTGCREWDGVQLWCSHSWGLCSGAGHAGEHLPPHWCPRLPPLPSGPTAGLSPPAQARCWLRGRRAGSRRFLRAHPSTAGSQRRC